MQRLVGRLILIFIMPAMSLWMIVAVWFSNLPGRVLPSIVAAGVGVGLLVILALVKGRWRTIGLVLCLFAVIYVWHLLISPSNDRNWKPSVARLSTASFAEDGNTVTVHNIRNFAYRSPQDFEERYYDQTSALKQIRGVDLIISYWGQDAMAHTFLSFAFEGG